MDEKRLGGIALTIILIGVGAWLRMSRRSDDSVNIKTDITQIVSMMEGYDQNKKLIDTMTDTAHRSAFNAAYSVGGRRSPVRFDEDKYLEAFWRSMIQQADMMGRSDLKKAILGLKASVESDDATSGELSSGNQSSVVDDEAKSPVAPNNSNNKEHEQSQDLPKNLSDYSDDQLHDELIKELVDRVWKAQDKDKTAVVRKLGKGERMLFVTMIAEGEVNNGGFYQFFTNSSGELAMDAVLAFKLIGAKKHANLMRRAIAAYVRSEPEQTEVKVDKAVKGYLKKYKDKDLDKLDSAFFDIKEDLRELRIKYIRAHLGEFGQK